MGVNFVKLFIKVIQRIFYFIHCSFFVFTKKPASKEVDCILMSALVNRGLVKNNYLFSQLLDVIYDELRSQGCNVLSIGSEYDNFYSQKNYYGNPINLNNYYKKKYFTYTLKNIFKIKNFNEFFLDEVLSLFKTKYLISIQPSKELCKVCSMKNIIVFDMQHGVIGDKHNNYYAKDKNFKKNKSEWPNYILCWNKNYADWVDSNLSDFTKSIIIGNPNLMNTNCNFTNSLDFHFIKNNFSKVVLVSLGRNLKYYKFSNDYGITKALIHSIKRNKNIFWLVKIHPFTIRNNKKEIYSLLNNEFHDENNIDWINSSEIPLNQLLGYIDLHITSISATIIEASLFGITSGVLSNKSLIQQLFPVEYKDNYIKCINDDETSITDFVNNYNIPPKNLLINEYHSNFLNFINDIVKKNI